MNIKTLAESFKYELTPEEMENEPVVFMILQSPIEFGRIFIDELKKEYGFSAYDEREFFDKLKDIIKEGPSRISSFSGFGDGISITISQKDNTNKNVARVKMVLNGLKLTTQINQLYYVFNSKEINTRQLAKKIVEKLKKIKEDDEYDANYGDEDYAYDVNLDKFKNSFTSFYFGQGTFSYSGIDMSIYFPKRMENMIYFIMEVAHSDSSYSPFEWGRMGFTMRYLSSIIDDIFQYFTDKGYNVEPHPDGCTNFRVTKVHDYSQEELIKKNNLSKEKYVKTWFSPKKMKEYNENEKKAVRAILTA